MAATHQTISFFFIFTLFLLLSLCFFYAFLSSSQVSLLVSYSQRATAPAGLQRCNLLPVCHFFLTVLKSLNDNRKSRFLSLLSLFVSVKVCETVYTKKKVSNRHTYKRYIYPEKITKKAVESSQKILYYITKRHLPALFLIQNWVPSISVMEIEQQTGKSRTRGKTKERKKVSWRVLFLIWYLMPVMWLFSL